VDRAGRSEVTLDRGLLADLPDDLRARLVEKLRRRVLAPGEVLALEGDPCPGLFLVSTGRIKIYKVSPDGREQVLLLARPGDTFADAAALTAQSMPACASAVEKSTVLVIPTPLLSQLIDEDSRFARAIIVHLCQKLQHVVHVVEDLSFLHVRARVAKILLQQLNPREGVGAGVGRRQLSQREIAEIAGTAREVVSRALSALEQEGLIRLEHGQIEVLKPEALGAML
jgi:CRP/FNR family transcriptional regulator